MAKPLLSIPVTEEQKKIVVDAATRARSGYAAWCRKVLLEVAQRTPESPKTVAPPEQTVSLPVNPVDMTQRLYDIILKRSGKPAADAWLESRKTKITPTVVVPEHLKAMYDNLVQTQGRAQADFWLLNNAGGKKIQI